MPYPEWLGNATLGTMAGAGSGFPPSVPTIADLGNAPPGDPFDIRYGRWMPARSPAGLPAYAPAPNAVPVPPPQQMPPRYEELQQPPVPPATILAQAQPPPFWQRFVGAFANNPMRPPSRPTPTPTPQLGAAPRFGQLGQAGRVRNIYGNPQGTV